MGLFGKSFEEKVEAALTEIRGMTLGIRNLTATVEDKVVTLHGETDSMEAKAKLAATFNQLVETDNTLNLVKVVKPAASTPAPVADPAPVVEAAPAARIHEVVAGDTLGAIAKRYYGNAGKYMKIFEANRDILKNPDLIKVGQKLRIPD